MFKRIMLLLVIIFIVTIVAVKILDYVRVSKIIHNIIGQNNDKYISQIDSEMISFGTPIATEIYVYKIKDVNKINCDLLKNYATGELVFCDFEKKYIDISKSYCSKYTKDNFNRTIYVIMQDGILLVKIFID